MNGFNLSPNQVIKKQNQVIGNKIKLSPNQPIKQNTLNAI